MKLHAQIKRPDFVYEQTAAKKNEDLHQPQRSEAINAAKQFLCGERRRSEQVLIGLHKGLILGELVKRVLVAYEAGAKLAADVENIDKKTIQQLISDPAFEWQPARQLQNVA